MRPLARIINKGHGSPPPPPPPTNLFAYMWGRNGPHLGLGYSSGAGCYPFSTGSIWPAGAIEDITLGAAGVAIVSGEVWALGIGQDSVTGQGNAWNPESLNVRALPVKVTGGIPMFNEQKHWQKPRIPGAFETRPEGPITPTVGSTNPSAGQRAVEVSGRGLSTHVLRKDGTAMGWGNAESLAGGWLGVIFYEQVQNPTQINNDEEYGVFYPCGAPNWCCIAYNSLVGNKFGNFVRQSDAKFSVPSSALGERSGVVHPVMAVNTHQRAVWQAVTPIIVEATTTAGKAEIVCKTEAEAKTLIGLPGDGDEIQKQGDTLHKTFPAGTKLVKRTGRVWTTNNVAGETHATLEKYEGFEARNTFNILYTAGSKIITCIGELGIVRSSEIWQGIWDSAMTYKLNDLVQEEGVYYKSTIASNLNKKPSTLVGWAVRNNTFASEAPVETTALEGLLAETANAVTTCEWCQADTKLVRKVTTNAKGEASSTSFEISRPALITFAENGPSSPVTILQSSFTTVTVTPDVLQPNPVTVVATGDLEIDLSLWTKSGEALLYVRQDAVGNHKITVTAGGKPIEWGSDGVPPENKEPRQIGPLTFGKKLNTEAFEPGNPVTEASELGNAKRWRYTFNTGKEGVTIIPLFNSGTKVYGGTLRPLGDGVVTAPITQIVASAGECLYLLSDGSIYASGPYEGNVYVFAHRAENTTSFAGPGLTPRPVSIGSGTGSLALMSDGTLKTWGANTFGQLGTGEALSVNGVRTPVLPGGELVQEISANEEDCMALGTSGKVYVWGRNFQGSAGQGTERVVVTTPTQVPAGGGVEELPALGTDPIVQVLASGQGLTGEGVVQATYCLALTRSGNLYSWGGNSWLKSNAQGGTLGDMSFVKKLKPVKAIGVPQTNITRLFGQSGTGSGVLAPGASRPLPSVEVTPDGPGVLLLKWKRQEQQLLGVPPLKGFSIAYNRIAVLRHFDEIARELPPAVSQSEKANNVGPIPYEGTYTDSHGVTYTANGVEWEYRIYLSTDFREGEPSGANWYFSGVSPNTIEIKITENKFKFETKTGKLTIVKGPYTVEGENTLIPVNWAAPLEPIWEFWYKYTNSYVVGGVTKTMGYNQFAELSQSPGKLTTLAVPTFHTSGSPATLKPELDAESMPTNLDLAVEAGRWNDHRMMAEFT